MSEPHVSDWKPRWQCAARQRNIGPDIQDCDWPFCGCDPYASKVLDAIAESGFKIVKDDGSTNSTKTVKGPLFGPMDFKPL